MKIYFERSGGFMGRPITCTVNTETLSSDEALTWQEMIKEASFFELPESAQPAAQGYDQFVYKLIVEDEENKHTVETTDAAAPDSLRPLLRKLTLATRSQH
jgi:hypothetical protein